ncbi:ABC transporter substrate-binding protein [Spirochaeta africana]|uniref:sn-glycerol-3-phosphate-binding periplasmic protein UgpB n=1 Tax=Spirochaeta africana (strain ATCC 700263 / DSM 8902 / Z-7692) TaxID=889378 RepID=H9UMS6_SPIAZ|nr:ABC transporter substrate-binding protein [Spirochaeta africana]AFG38819.1 ABC-type sugar transport system, periplasmic component [Spirochaeta africana DSM 8902]
MKKFLLIATVLVISAVLVLPAFGAGQTERETHIRIMGYGGQDPAVVQRLLDEVIGQQLTEENIRLTYEPLEGDYNAAFFNALSAGTAGDIFYIPVETAPGIIATGQVLPLDDYVDTSPFIDSLVETYTFDGRVYGIAKDFNTLAIHYNKDLFDEAGVEYPNAGDTWESLAEKARRVSDLGADVYGIAFPPAYDRFGAFAYATGWEPFDEQGNTNLLDPRFVSAVEWYTGLVADGVAVMPSDIGQDWTGGAFATENVGMAIEGAWILGFLRNEAPNIQFGTTFMPIGPSGQRGNFLYTVAYGINANSRNREAAIKVLEALTSPEAQQFILEEGLALPSREELADNPFLQGTHPEAVTNRVVFQGAEDGNVLGAQYGTVGTDWFQPINAALGAIMSEDGDVQTELQRAQREIEALIERAR